jgi:WD40 repeat protein
VIAVVFAPDGHLLSASYDHTIRLWDVAAGKEIRAVKIDRGLVRNVALSPDAKRALTGGDDGTLTL